MSRCIYEALPQGYEYIRQLEYIIRRDPTTSQPEWDLQLAPFDQAHWDIREYSALSYTWGDCTPTHNILVNGHCHEVRQNLFDFFEAYLTHSWGSSKPESRRSDRRFWIDQICINQADVDERSSQVGMMNKIYKAAKRVLVWLGNDPHMVAAARQIQMGRTDSRQAVGTLLSHSYFSRLWIVQEVALAREVDVVCGDVELSWLSLQYAIGNQIFPPERRATLGQPLESAAALVLNSRKPRQSLKDCISRYCNNQCQDPRDKVYGLLGMTSERWRLKIDYSRSVLEVFLDVVMALYEELFDRLDPACHYGVKYRGDIIKEQYRTSLSTLAGAIGLPTHQLNGLLPFLKHLQETFLKTKCRNVRFTFRGRIPRIENEDEITVRWDSVTATRRNPLMRDVIPRMGLLSDHTCSHLDIARDCWYFQHGDYQHIFPCPSTSDTREYCRHRVNRLRMKPVFTSVVNTQCFTPPVSAPSHPSHGHAPPLSTTAPIHTDFHDGPH